MLVMSIIKNNLITQSIVDEYIEDVGLTPRKIDEINVGDIFIFDKETKEQYTYGNINDIIHTEEFKTWYMEKYGNKIILEKEK